MTEQFTSMSRKVQLLVGFLVLSAVVATWQLLGLVRFPSTLKASIHQGIALESPDNDTDRDGLANEEESYWNTDFQDPDSDGDGYKDGEEVASGHDPLVPGPDDPLITSNVTQALDQLIVAGLYEGSLKPNSQNFNTSLDQIADAVTASDNTTVQKYSFVIVSTTVENIERYKLKILENMRALMTSIAPARETGTPEELFRPPIVRIRAIVETLSAFPVPKNYQSLHGQFLSVLNDLANQYQAVISLGDDPIQQAVIVGQLAHIFDERLPSILEQYRSLLQPTQ